MSKLEKCTTLLYNLVVYLTISKCDVVIKYSNPPLFIAKIKVAGWVEIANDVCSSSFSALAAVTITGDRDANLELCLAYGL